jgi:hypothetical protein
MQQTTNISNKAIVINALHEEIKINARKTIEAVIKAGNMLNEIKAELKHGDFNKWCEQNLNLSRTTIFRYMTISQNTDKIIDAQTPSEAMKIIAECSNMKHLKSGLYIKDNCGALLIIHVKDGFIGYVQHSGSSYTCMRSISEDWYIKSAHKTGSPIPDKSFHFISEDKNCPIFKEYFTHVPNEWFFFRDGGGFFEKHLTLITCVAPPQFHIQNYWSDITDN